MTEMRQVPCNLLLEVFGTVWYGSGYASTLRIVFLHSYILTLTLSLKVSDSTTLVTNSNPSSSSTISA